MLKKAHILHWPPWIVLVNSTINKSPSVLTLQLVVWSSNSILIWTGFLVKMITIHTLDSLWRTRLIAFNSPWSTKHRTLWREWSDFTLSVNWLWSRIYTHLTFQMGKPKLWRITGLVQLAYLKKKKSKTHRVCLMKIHGNSNVVSKFHFWGNLILHIIVFCKVGTFVINCCIHIGCTQHFWMKGWVISFYLDGQGSFIGLKHF